MPRPILISGGRVLDPEGELHAPIAADILISSGLIVEVGATTAERAAVLDAEVIDASGLLVTPGFVNAHSHSHDVLLRGCFEQEPLEVWGLTAFPTGWPRRPLEEVLLRTELHAAECLRGGMTTVQDMVTIVGPDGDHAAAVIGAYERSGLRTVLAFQVSDLAPAKSLPFIEEELSRGLVWPPSSDSDPQPVQGFIERHLAASAAGRLTWGIAPSAPQRCSDTLLAWAAQLSQDRELPLFTHLYETRTQAVLARSAYSADGKSLLNLMHRNGLLNPRTVVAHGVWITPDEIDRLAGAGVQLACNPSANLKLLNGAAPVRRYADAGVSIALGCDNSSASDAQNIFQAMKLFALWWSLQSRVGESGAAAAAFRAATVGGAVAVGLGGQVGRVQPGYKADLLLFDLSDPAWKPLNSAVRQLVYAETGRGLRTVIVDGQVVVDRRRLETLNEADMDARLTSVHQRVLHDLREIVARNAPLAAALRRMSERAKAVPLDIDPCRLAASH
jgi:5-methylthioadenosine/S-adenosylhomocysteine deaminase